VPDRSAAPLAIRLFGPFELRLHGHPTPCLRSRKGQWLLALLTLRAGRDVERDWLAGTLWPDSPEAAARANLRSSLKELRRALGEQAPRLCSPTLRTLTLDLAGIDVDVLAFDAALARGDWPALEQAVWLYRGPLLEGCVEAWAFQERQVREQAYLGALERLAEEALASGNPATAERHLRQAVGVDPLRESAQRGLMRALAAGGNEAAALRVYRELRLLLQREMNTEPGAETRALFEQLRAEARRRAEAAARVRPGRAATGPPPAEARLNNLPIPPTPLLGREEERAAARELLGGRAPAEGGSPTRLLTLIGPPGTGKTRLALQVATDLLEAFEDGVFLVPLAPISDPNLVLSTIAQILGVRETGSQPLVATLKADLREKHLLLLLDNFEQVIPAATQVAELLTAAPRLRVLVTSRTVLCLRGEKEFPVPPLALPTPGSLPTVEALSQYAAVALFIQRALDVRPDFAITNENAPAVAEICHRLDGLPLAIELAAARVKLFPPQALLARLNSRLKLLTGGARDLPVRQQTLRSAIAWSYDLLGEGDKTLFRRLCVFAGGATLEAIQAVCDAEDDLGVDVLDGVASLVGKSLLQQDETADDEPRFRMLETIREYAAERLTESGEAEPLARCHVDYFLGLAEEAEHGFESTEQLVWLARLDADHDNLRAALRWAVEHEEGREIGLRLAGALQDFWVTRGHRHEGWQWLESALARARAIGRTAARAKCLCGSGRLAEAQYEYEAARLLLQESVAIYRELGRYFAVRAWQPSSALAADAVSTRPEFVCGASATAPLAPHTAHSSHTADHARLPR
jgi:predicted ATPase/DNA-binding SARP family transcriptional activator